MVLASNTELLEVTLAPIDGPYVVDLTIDAVNLGPGQYYVNANAAGVSEPSNHGLMQASLFTVVGDSRTIGTVSATIRLAGSGAES